MGGKDSQISYIGLLAYEPAARDYPAVYRAQVVPAAAPQMAVSATSNFVYDGDGRRVKATVNGVTTYFVGNHYEVTDGVVTKYYYAGSARIAMRQGGTLYFLLTDHLGSTSLVTNAAGAVVSRTQYKAWGEVRYSSGANPSEYTFTGQYSHTADFGLMFYNARWYDSSLSRFAQADTIVPPGVQGLDRYAYANNSPVRYTDPSGHDPVGNCYDKGYCHDPEVAKLAIKIQSAYKNVAIQDVSKWYLLDLQEIDSGLNKIMGKNGFNGNMDAFNNAFGMVTFVPMANGSLGATGNSQNVAKAYYDSTGEVRVTPNASRENIIHEMGHIFDGTLRRANPEANLRSQEFVEKFNTGTCTISPCYDDFGGWNPKGVTTSYGKMSSLEDFGDSFLAVFKYGPTYENSTVGQPRILIIQSLIQSYTDSTILHSR